MFRRFTQVENDFIQQNYLKLSDRTIADHLGRSVLSISCYRRTHGMKKGLGKGILSHKKINLEVLKKLAEEGMPVVDLARYFNTQTGTIRNFARRHDILIPIVAKSKINEDIGMGLFEKYCQKHHLEYEIFKTGSACDCKAGDTLVNVKYTSRPVDDLGHVLTTKNLRRMPKGSEFWLFNIHGDVFKLKLISKESVEFGT